MPFAGGRKTRPRVAELAVSETGMGRVDDKLLKRGAGARRMTSVFYLAGADRR